MQLTFMQKIIIEFPEVDYATVEEAENIKIGIEEWFRRWMGPYLKARLSGHSDLFLDVSGYDPIYCHPKLVYIFHTETEWNNDDQDRLRQLKEEAAESA